MKKNESSSTRLSEALAVLTVVGASVLLAGPSLAANTNVNLTASNQFDQATVTVGEGDTVTFTWQGGFHDVVFADGVSSGAPVGIDGTTFSRTFDVAGTYDYVCTVHESSGMVGTVIVEATTAEPTTPASDTTPTTAPSSGGSTATTAPAAESTATTTVPSSGAVANAAPSGGASGGGSGSGAATAQPFTGPERSMLPAAGVVLVLAGLVIRLRLRRTG